MTDLVALPETSGPESTIRPGSKRTASPRRLRRLITQADAARDRRDWREAVRLYGLVLEASPALHAMRVQLGNAFKEIGDFDRAGRRYHAALQLSPADDDLYLQIGHLEKLKGNASEAANCYRRAAELNPENFAALVEYYGLAAKLGLPSLAAISSSGAKDQGPTEARDGPGKRSPAAARRTPAADPGLAHDRQENEPDRAAIAAAEKSLIDGAPTRVLYVSDNLGTPIHARGIFHYSTALAEILRTIGFEITLVVEKSPGYGLERRTPGISCLRSLSTITNRQKFSDTSTTIFFPSRGDMRPLVSRG